MITIGSITNLEKNNTLAEQLWQDSDYELIIKFTLVKKIKYNKRTFMVDIGYKATDNLMGSRICKNSHDIINMLFY
jgi:hypothetical protein